MLQVCPEKDSPDAQAPAHMKLHVCVYIMFSHLVWNAYAEVPMIYIDVEGQKT